MASPLVQTELLSAEVNYSTTIRKPGEIPAPDETMQEVHPAAPVHPDLPNGSCLSARRPRDDLSTSLGFGQLLAEVATSKTL